MKSGQEEIVRNSQNSRIKSVLEATNWKAVRPEATKHERIAAEEVQVEGTWPANRRAPIVAEAAHTVVEQGIAAIPVASRG